MIYTEKPKSERIHLYSQIHDKMHGEYLTVTSINQREVTLKWNPESSSKMVVKLVNFDSKDRFELMDTEEARSEQLANRALELACLIAEDNCENTGNDYIRTNLCFKQNPDYGYTCCLYRDSCRSRVREACETHAREEVKNKEETK
jgi:hypothetical protein